MLNLPLCHWSSQLFDLRVQSSTDVPVLLLISLLSGIFYYLRTAENLWMAVPFMYNFRNLSDKYPTIFWLKFPQDDRTDTNFTASNAFLEI